MKKKQILFVVFLLISVSAFAQKTTVNLSFVNAGTNNCVIHIPAYALFFDYANKGNLHFNTDKDGNAKVELQLASPIFAILSFNMGDISHFEYQLYLSPGDNIKINVDHDNKISVTGNGSENNQPLIADIADPHPMFYGDSLPNHIISIANDYHNRLQTAFNAYVKQYHPTSDFIKNETENINYSTLQVYFCFKENNKFQMRDAYKRNKSKWDSIQDSLFHTSPLDNVDAANTANYSTFLANFMVREKERLWRQYYENRASFLKDWYNADTAIAKKEYSGDMQNILSEKIANRYFTGKACEQAYAVLFDYALLERNYANIPSIFDRFSAKFPKNIYTQWYAPLVDTIRGYEKRQLTSEMTFLPDNGTKINTFEELRSVMKGKTILLDMWGTWCGPCRNEINDNAAALHAYFKDKGVDFLYAANFDIDSPENWKKTIAMFNIRGTHLLANAKLTKDIMTIVKGAGYPTYVIIKKDGSWELSKAGFPMKRDVLIAQLNAALAQ